MKKLLAFFVVIIPVVAILVITLTSAVVGTTVEIAVEDITLSVEAGSVSVNTSQKIDYDIYPKKATNREVLYTSSDESVATVDQSGNVVFIGFGTVYVTVTTVDGGKSKSCVFNVVSDNVFGINLLVDKKELLVNDSACITATVFPQSAKDKSVLFKSSDESIATVDGNGIVNAVGNGRVVITATSSDGNVSNGITIDVATKAESVEITAENTVNEREFVELRPKFFPENTSESYKKLTYKSSDTSVAAVSSNGKVQFIKTGSVTITASTAYGISDSIVLFYTGGLPLSVGSEITSYKLTYDDVNLANNSGKLSLVFSENSTVRNVVYKSSNNNVVSVDGFGVYSVNGGGYATVSATVDTAAVEDGKLVFTKKTLQFSFEITRRPTAVKADKFSVTTLNTYQINASVLPADASVKSVSYISQDKEVADVSSDGVITFKKAGVAFIKITAEGNDSASTIICVTSTMGYPIDCTVSGQSKYLIQGTARTLKTTFYPADATIKDGVWSVSDDNVITVDANGVVSALNTGDATVFFTCTVWNESIAATEEKTFSYDVTVYRPVESVTAEMPAGISKEGDVYVTAKPNFKLSYSYQPSNIAATVSFYSMNEDVAVIDKNGNVYFKKSGIAKFYVGCTSTNSKCDSSTVTVNYLGLGPKNANFNYMPTMWTGDNCVITAADIFPSDAADYSYTLTQSTGNSIKIDGYKITAVSAGTSVLTASYANGFSKKMTISVKQAVTDIALAPDISFSNAENKYVTAKSVVNLVTSVAPQNATDKSLAYVSSDESVATVENGVVTFKKAGEVTVTVKAKDGSGTEKAVTVRSTYNNIEKVGLVSDSIFVETYLRFVCYPADATGVDVSVNIVSQSSENVLTFYNGKYYGSSEGTAVINLSVTNPDESTVINNNVSVGVYLAELISFTVSDFEVTEGSDFNVKDNITIGELSPNTADVGIYLSLVTLTLTPSSENLTIDGNTVTAIRYGQYTLTVKIGDIEQIANVNVLVAENNVEIAKLSNENVAASNELTKTESGGKVAFVTGYDKFSIGQPSLVNRNNNFNIDFSYSSSDDTVATVDSAGNVTFVKAGSVIISVGYAMSASAAKNSAKSGVMYYDSGYSVILDYRDKTEAFDTSLSGELLDESAVKEYKYENIADFIKELTYSNVYPKCADFGSKVTVSVKNAEGAIPAARVTDGKIEILGGGTFAVTVGADGINYVYNVKVNRLITGIEGQNDLLTAQSVVQLSAPATAPADATDKTYFFISSDDTVATVSGNVLTFSKAGSVEVTVKNLASGLYDTFVITSTAGGIKDYSLDTNNIELNKGETHLVSCTVSPENATTYSFEFEVLSYQANHGSAAEVISVSPSGLVTALCGGTATVIVSSTNAFGSVVTKNLTVTVIEKTSGIELQKPSVSDKDENGRYITALRSITLSAEAKSQTATVKTLIFSSSDNTIATVSREGVVSFITRGYVTITVKCADNDAISKSVDFFYVDKQPVSVLINGITDGQNLDIGAVITLSVSAVVPADFSISDIAYNIEIIENNYNGNTPCNVVSVNGNKITGVSGGRAVLRIIVNNVIVGEYSVVVKSPLTDITVDKTNVAFESSESQANYKITASTVPTHTDDTLRYEVLSGSGVSVDSNGLVSFNGYTSAVIRVSGTAAAVYKDVAISFTEKTLIAIKIRPMVNKTALFSGESYTLAVYAEYALSEEKLNNSSVTFTNNTSSLLSSVTSGVVTAANDVYGEASVTATYKGKSSTLKFIVAPNISGIAFTLNAADDKCGIKGERVFGTMSFTSAAPTALSQTTNAYQMSFNAITDTFGAPLVWESSDTSVATVDDNGVVTRKKAGNATVTCRPYYQYAEEMASYTFKFVYGADVYNITQYELFTSELAANYNRASAANNLPAVLHSDIVYTSAYGPNFWDDGNLKGDYPYRAFRAISNLYGNGHTLDASAAQKSTWTTPIAFQLFESDVVIDNVNIIGCSFDESGNDLSYFSDAVYTLAIRSYGNGKYIKGVSIKNTLIKNGNINVWSYSAEFSLSGCIIKNAYSGNVILNCYGTHLDWPSKAVMKNCVVENSLMPSVDLKVDKENVTEANSNVLTIEGDIYVNNWRSKAQIPSTGLSDQYAKIVKEAFDELKQFDGLAYGDYINFGISRITATSVTYGNFYNYGKIIESVPYLSDGTGLSVKKYIALFVGYATIVLNTVYGNNLQSLPYDTTQKLVPGTKIDSRIYPYIRDVGV